MKLRAILFTLALAATSALATYDPLGGYGHRSIIHIDDDFCGANNAVTSANQNLGSLGWSAARLVGTGSALVFYATNPLHPCMLYVPTTATSTHATVAHLGNSVTAVATIGVISGATAYPFDSTWVFSITSTAAIRAYIGFSATTTPAANGCWVRYDSATDTTFKLECCKVSVCSSVNGPAIDTAWHRLRVRALTAGTILMSIDGGAETSFGSTNVPVLGTIPVVYVRTSAAVAKAVGLDYFSFRRDGAAR